MAGTSKHSCCEEESRLVFSEVEKRLKIPTKAKATTPIANTTSIRLNALRRFEGDANFLPIC